MKKYLTTALCTFIIISSSCIFSNDKEDNEIMNYVFPLEIGNSWEYSAINSDVYFFPGTKNISSEDTTFSYTSTIEIKGTETLLGYKDTYVFQDQTTVESGEIFENNLYYLQKDDGLYIIAYEGNSSILVLKPTTDGITYSKDKDINSTNDFTPFIPNSLSAKKTPSEKDLHYSSHRMLKYPFGIGSEWYCDYSGWVGIEKRIVIGKEYVTVPAGTFHCFKIARLFDNDNDGEWDDTESYDYICSQGIIKRTMFFKRLIYSDYPDSTDELRGQKYEKVLTNIHL